MAQDTLYFPHDYDPLQDPKTRKLIRKHQAVGYAVYWRLVEYLHQNSEHQINFNSGIINDVADDFGIETDVVNDIMDYCINGCNLFGADGIMFWSDRVHENIKKRSEISKQRSLAGKASADARKRDKEAASVQQPLTDVQQPSTKKER